MANPNKNTVKGCPNKDPSDQSQVTYGRISETCKALEFVLAKLRVTKR